MPKNIIKILVLLGFACDLNSSCNNSHDKIINSVIKGKIYEGGKNPFRGFPEKDLEALSYHQNPIIRCYAFKELTSICSNKVFDILVNHLNDTAKFERTNDDGFGYEDILGDDRVTDNFLDKVGYDKKQPGLYSLSEQQYDHIDSILLYKDEIKQRSYGSIVYRSRRFLLEYIKPLPEHYQRIKELVQNNVYEALPTLAKYQRENDTALFKNLLLNNEFSNEGRTMKIYIRKSILYFPNPSFLPILKKQLMDEIGTNEIYDEIESIPLYFALVQYPSKGTNELFKTALKNSGKEYKLRLQFINFALKQYPSKFFK